MDFCNSHKRYDLEPIREEEPTESSSSDTADDEHRETLSLPYRLRSVHRVENILAPAPFSSLCCDDTDDVDVKHFVTRELGGTTAKDMAVRPYDPEKDKDLVMLEEQQDEGGEDADCDDDGVGDNDPSTPDPNAQKTSLRVLGWMPGYPNRLPSYSDLPFAWVFSDGRMTVAEIEARSPEQPATPSGNDGMGHDSSPIFKVQWHKRALKESDLIRGSILDGGDTRIIRFLGRFPTPGA
ncbi:hypothetical protein PG994_013492 [Apiospora phragmitis]|uniref:Uncharacterized protein n=1 Tax=Apiospora phragmitis TaxID=2905665 RepID=A0ABR1TB18_9PEZI